MSTDTYFDFSTTELAATAIDGVTSENWQAWNGKRKELEAQGVKCWETCRIGYLYNFVCEYNYDNWVTFEKRWDRVIVAETMIPEFLQEYKHIYDMAFLDPENSFHDDLCAPDEINDALREHLGWVLDFRVD